MIRGAAQSAGHTQHSKSDQIGRSLIGESNPYSLTQERSQHGSWRSAASDRPLEDLPNPLRANSSFRPIFSSDPTPETAHHRRRIGAVVLSIFLLLLAGAGIFIANNKRQVGASIIRLGERLSGEQSQQPTNSAPPTVARSTVTSAPGPPEFATEEPQTAPPSDVAANASGPESAKSACGSAVKSRLGPFARRIRSAIRPRRRPNREPSRNNCARARTAKYS